MINTYRNKLNNEEKGFTLIELLLTIGILAILLAITLLAINPARQFAQARNTNRRDAISQILNAVGSYFADHAGTLPTDLSAMPVNNLIEIASTTMPNFCSQMVTAYMPAIPQDPQLGAKNITQADCGGFWDSGYMLMKDGSNRVTVSATNAEIGATINIVR